jgi:MoaA/NifB/PqqE/SkfB family radical SAM enzyme
MLALVFSKGTHANIVTSELETWRGDIQSRYGVVPKRGGGEEKCLKCYSKPDGGAYLLWLELAQDCNLNCEFCYNPWRPEGSHVRARRLLQPAEYIKAVSTILSSVRIHHVTLSGGEPLLFTKLDELLASIKENGCESIGMTTNGRSLTRRRLDSLHSDGLNSLTIPLHSHRPHVHDTLSGGTSWKSAVRALALGVEKAIPVAISCVVTAKNREDIPRVADIARYLGVSTLILNCMHAAGQGGARTDLIVTDAEFDSAVVQARHRLVDKVAVIIGSPPVDGNNHNKAIDRIVLSPHGDIKLCNQSHDGVLNVYRDTADEVRAFFSSISNGEIDPYSGRVDNCACRGTA